MKKTTIKNKILVTGLLTIFVLPIFATTPLLPISSLSSQKPEKVKNEEETTGEKFVSDIHQITLDDKKDYTDLETVDYDSTSRLITLKKDIDFQNSISKQNLDLIDINFDGQNHSISHFYDKDEIVQKINNSNLNNNWSSSSLVGTNDGSVSASELFLFDNIENSVISNINFIDSPFIFFNVIDSHLINVNFSKINFSDMNIELSWKTDDLSSNKVSSINFSFVAGTFFGNSSWTNSSVKDIEFKNNNIIFRSAFYKDKKMPDIRISAINNIREGKKGDPIKSSDTIANFKNLSFEGISIFNNKIEIKQDESEMGNNRTNIDFSPLFFEVGNIEEGSSEDVFSSNSYSNDKLTSKTLNESSLKEAQSFFINVSDIYLRDITINGNETLFRVDSNITKKIIGNYSLQPMIYFPSNEDIFINYEDIYTNGFNTKDKNAFTDYYFYINTQKTKQKINYSNTIRAFNIDSNVSNIFIKHYIQNDDSWLNENNVFQEFNQEIWELDKHSLSLKKLNDDSLKFNEKILFDETDHSSYLKFIINPNNYFIQTYKIEFFDKNKTKMENLTFQNKFSYKSDSEIVTNFETLNNSEYNQSFSEMPLLKEKDNISFIRVSFGTFSSKLFFLNPESKENFVFYNFTNSYDGNNLSIFANIDDPLGLITSVDFQIFEKNKELDSFSISFSRETLKGVKTISTEESIENLDNYNNLYFVINANTKTQSIAISIKDKNLFIDDTKDNFIDYWKNIPEGKNLWWVYLIVSMTIILVLLLLVLMILKNKKRKVVASGTGESFEDNSFEDFNGNELYNQQNNVYYESTTNDNVELLEEDNSYYELFDDNLNNNSTPNTNPNLISNDALAYDTNPNLISNGASVYDTDSSLISNDASTYDTDTEIFKKQYEEELRRKTIEEHKRIQQEQLKQKRIEEHKKLQKQTLENKEKEKLQKEQQEMTKKLKEKKTFRTKKNIKKPDGKTMINSLSKEDLIKIKAIVEGKELKEFTNEFLEKDDYL